MGPTWSQNGYAILTPWHGVGIWIPKMAVKWFQDAPRGPKRSPIGPQDGPKMATHFNSMAWSWNLDPHAGPNMAPRWPKMAPRWSQKGPKVT